MTGRQHEAVPVGPARVPRRVAEMAGPQGVRHRRGAHRCAGVPGVRLLDAIDREGADGVDRELIEAVRGEGHSLSPVARGLGRRGGICRAPIVPRRSARVCSADMPPILVTRRARTHHRVRRTTDRPSVVVVGDIVVDVILAPERDIELGSDVRGRVLLRAGGSAATAARWLGRLGARSTLVCAVGRDGQGRALVSARPPTASPCARCASPARRPRASACSSTRTASARSSRIAAPRSCCAPRTSGPRGSRAPTPSISPRTRSSTSRSGGPAWQAIRLGRAAGALITVDLASSAPLLALGRRRSTGADHGGGARPAVRHPRRGEGAPRDQVRRAAARARADRRRQAGPQGRVDPRPRPTASRCASTSPRRRSSAADTTGAGDAFDAGFLLAWLDARRRGVAPAAALQRGAIAGNRAALRQLRQPRPELSLGYGARGPEAVDAALLALEVLELGRRADVVRGELDELVGRQVATARVADEDVDAASPAPAGARAGRARRARPRTSSRRRG